VHTGFLSDHRAELREEPAALAGKLLALAVMGELARRARSADAADGWSPWSDTRCFRVNAPRRDRLELRIGSEDVDVEVAFEADVTLLRSAQRTLRVQLASSSDAGGQLTLLVDGEKVSGSYVTRGARSFVLCEGRSVELVKRSAARQVDEDAAALGALRSPLPGRVLNVAVSAGQRVLKGEVLLSLEAMKMEHTLRASVEGVVSELSVRQGDQVAEGSTLLVLQAAAGVGDARANTAARDQE
jgi:3-methylcrotonyl-CoA carboxylase alpha subunit